MGEMADGIALFQGDSEVDQLYKIQKVLGEFPEELNEYFSKNPRYFGYKFPDLRKPETLERRYVGRLSKKALDLCSRMLELIPRDRITAAEAILHPYFNDIRDPDLEALLKSKIKSSQKAAAKANNQKERLMKRLRNKSSSSPNDRKEKDRSKPRGNRFSDLSSKMSSKYSKDNAYRSLSKGPLSNKNKGKPPINFKDGK